ncbi:MAG TPA: xanthine dehydrogenase family protein subunit M, partial [Symbiobacteriaceae bacterium]|nr:xanthine dehydrogenase family protein subunit M [Symbiobacteriaceae bacterium]
RTIPLDEFFVGPGKTVLQPDELLTEIRVPQTAPASGSAYVKIGRVSGDIAKVNAAVALEREGGVCTGCRIALGSVGPTVVRGRGAESRLLGETVSLSLIRAAARQAAEEIRPITDLRSTATYRKTVTAVMLEELLITAWGRAGGGLPK